MHQVGPNLCLDMHNARIFLERQSKSTKTINCVSENLRPDFPFAETCYYHLPQDNIYFIWIKMYSFKI